MLLRKLNRRDSAPLFVSYVFSGASPDVFTRSTYGGTISDLTRRGHRERLRGEMGRAVKLRYTPELVFVEDRTTERAIALSKVLAESAAKADAAANAEAAGKSGNDAPE